MDERTDDQADVDQETLNDLDVDQDDADKVIGGKPGASPTPARAANSAPVVRGLS